MKVQLFRLLLVSFFSFMAPLFGQNALKGGISSFNYGQGGVYATIVIDGTLTPSCNIESYKTYVSSKISSRTISISEPYNRQFCIQYDLNSLPISELKSVLDDANAHFESLALRPPQFIQEITNHLNVDLKLTLPMHNLGHKMTEGDLPVKYCTSLTDGSSLKPGRFAGEIILPAQSKMGFDELVIPYNGPTKFGCHSSSLSIGYHFEHFHGRSVHPKHIVTIGFNNEVIDMRCADTCRVNSQKMIGGHGFSDRCVPGAKYALSIDSERKNLRVNPIDRYFHDNNRLIINISKIEPL